MQRSEQGAPLWASPHSPPLNIRNCSSSQDVTAFSQLFQRQKHLACHTTITRYLNWSFKTRSQSSWEFFIVPLWQSSLKKVEIRVFDRSIIVLQVHPWWHMSHNTCLHISGTNGQKAANLNGSVPVSAKQCTAVEQVYCQLGDTSVETHIPCKNASLDTTV